MYEETYQLVLRRRDLAKTNRVNAASLRGLYVKAAFLAWDRYRMLADHCLPDDDHSIEGCQNDIANLYIELSIATQHRKALLNVSRSCQLRTRQNGWRTR